MCQRVDIGSDHLGNLDTSSGTIIAMSCDMGACELRVLAASLSDASLQLREAFQVPVMMFGHRRGNKKHDFQKLREKLDLLMLKTIPKEKDGFDGISPNRPRVRLSRARSCIRLSSRSHVRRPTFDSRSGMKGKTIKRRIGKL